MQIVEEFAKLFRSFAIYAEFNFYINLYKTGKKNCNQT